VNKKDFDKLKVDDKVIVSGDYGGRFDAQRGVITERDGHSVLIRAFANKILKELDR
jgi:hypothetical protein